MKKMLCLFLMLWWPVFAMAAQRMQLEMQLASTPLAGLDSQQATNASCQHSLNAMAKADLVDLKDSADLASHHAAHGLIHTCKICGYCVVLAGLSNFTAFPNVIGFASIAVKPVLPTALFHSQSYPPAIKPPISA